MSHFICLLGFADLTGLIITRDQLLIFDFHCLHDTLHRGVGDELAKEVQLGVACLPEPIGDGPDRTVVQIDPEMAVIELVEIGEEALCVEQVGDDADPLVDRLAGELISCGFDEAAAARRF